MRPASLSSYVEYHIQRVDVFTVVKVHEILLAADCLIAPFADSRLVWNIAGILSAEGEGGRRKVLQGHFLYHELP